jgi:prepilin-type N-terminal cleavage/methylation domain-containing protein
MLLRRCAAVARRRLAAEHGYSLSEMLVVLAIIGIVLTALTQLFVSASTAQVDMTRRFEAQQNMRLALDKMRREIHCAKEVSGAAPSSSIAIKLGSYCPTATTGATSDEWFTWCIRDKNDQAPPNPDPNLGAPYSLWRFSGTNCSGTGRKWGDYLTKDKVFTAFPPTPPGSLPTLSVELPVDLTPGDSKQFYKLTDDIVLRNVTRLP